MQEGSERAGVARLQPQAALAVKIAHEAFATEEQALQSTDLGDVVLKALGKRDHVRVVANVAVVLLPKVDRVRSAVTGKPEMSLAIGTQKKESSREKSFRALPFRVERDAWRRRYIRTGLDKQLPARLERHAHHRAFGRRSKPHGLSGLRR